MNVTYSKLIGRDHISGKKNSEKIECGKKIIKA